MNTANVQKTLESSEHYQKVGVKTFAKFHLDISSLYMYSTEITIHTLP